MADQEQSSEPVAIFESDRNAAVYAYYTAVRGNRAMPSRAQIDPEKLKRHLPYLYVVRVIQQEDSDARFQVGLMGTELVEVLKQEGKDRFIGELNLGGFEQVWRRNLLYSYQSKMPVVALERVRLNTGLELEFEHLVLPLSSDGLAIDRLFGCFDFPRFSDSWVSDNLSNVQWTGPIHIEVPKRLLITQLDLPPE